MLSPLIDSGQRRGRGGYFRVLPINICRVIHSSRFTGRGTVAPGAEHPRRALSHHHLKHHPTWPARPEAAESQIRTSIAQPKYHHARPMVAAERHNLRKIEIKRQNESILGCGLREDLAIRQAMELLIAQMDRVVAHTS